MSNADTKFHRDGSVTIWDVYTQSWSRTPATELVATCPQLLATLPEADRKRIERMAAKAA